MQFPSPHILQPASASTSPPRTVIFLHGRDSHGKEFAEDISDDKTSEGKNLFEHLEGNKQFSTKWIFPSAHQRYSSFWQCDMNEWFDIWSLRDPAERSETQVEGLRESIIHIHNIINEEINSGTKPSDIFLGGISQGFAVAIHVLLTQPYCLGGFFGVSGWCPFSGLLGAINRDQCDKALILEATVTEMKQLYQKQFDIEAKTTTQTFGTPILVSHCADDDVVEICHGKVARDSLNVLGFKNVTWEEYVDGEHWINEPKGVDAIVTIVERKNQDNLANR